MRDVFYWFWTVMIFSSIAWYFFLLFYVGVKGGWEVVRLTEALSNQGKDRKPV
jgi:hypothetical protein